MTNDMVDFLLELRELGIAISVEGDQLLLEAAPGVLTAEHRAVLTANKADILRLLRTDAGESLATNSGTGSEVGRGQRSVWLLDQLSPGNSAWNIASAFSIDGTLDRRALSESFRAILTRHRPLRSRFVEADGTLVAEALPVEEWAIDYRDVRGDPEAEARCASIIDAESCRPFDLSIGPLFRVVLVQTSDESHTLLIALHHIVADGWSLGIIFSELNELYSALNAGKASPLAPLTHDYADFVALENRQDGTAAANAAWWRERLSGDLPVVRLSRDRPQSADRGRRLTFGIDAELRAAVEVAARQCDVTPFMFLFAAFALLVHRLLNQNDVLIMTPTSNRDRREFAGLVGLFTNPVALRVHFADGMSVADLVALVRTTILEAFSRPISFDRVVEAIPPEQRATENPLAQLSFAYQNLAIPTLRLGNATVALRPLEFVGSRFELSLEVWPTGTGLQCMFEYANELFEPLAIQRIMEQYRTVLAAMVADSAQPIAHVPLVDESERHRLIVELNDTARPYRSDACIHELFMEQAARTPEAPALFDDREQLSYREVDERSNQLAHHLQRLGVGPEVPVGMCIDRSVHLVVAMLGILKAGGAYVPLDPTYPAERLRFMLEDAQTRLLVRRTREPNAVPYEGTVVDLERDAETIAAAPVSAPAGGATADNLAYIIYTSGSTGRPKGTMLRHSAVALIDWARTVYDANDLARNIAASSVCFDFSVFEIFVPLALGGAVIVAEDALHLPGGDLKPTMLSTVPSALAELARGGLIPETVRTINSGGELLTNALAQELYETTNALRVINVYGPTEFTTLTTTSLVERGASSEPAIGRPLLHTQLYVLDANRELLPEGSVGELYIAGDGLARGYWNRPELTAERFVPNPFGSPGSRMYKTGDHVRWRDDGQLEFVGRIDHQIKLRGFRVELGEIESVLLRYPGVRDAVAIVNRESAEDARLLAYVAADRDRVDPGSLRAHAKAYLPGYMAPSDVVVLHDLPRNPSGKVDRAALPRPEQLQGDAAAPLDTVLDPLERIVVRVFREVLGAERLSPTDNFFDAGGHSLLALQAANRLALALGHPVTALSVFHAPTARELTALLDLHLRAPDGHIATLQPLGDEPPLFCFHDITSHAVHYSKLVRYLDRRQPVYGVATAHLERALVENPNLDILIRGYAKDIKRIQPNGPYRLCGYSAAGILAYEVGRALSEAGEEVLVVLFDTYIIDRVALTRVALRNLVRAVFSGRFSELAAVRKQLVWCRQYWFRELRLRDPRNLPSWVPEHSRELALALFRAQVTHRYRAFHGETLLFEATVREDQEEFLSSDGMNGWARLVKGPFQRIALDGDHFEMMREPLVVEMAGHLQRALSAQTAGQTPPAPV
jgi:amino acid adenylation domain-containing protein